MKTKSKNKSHRDNVKLYQQRSIQGQKSALTLRSTSCYGTTFIICIRDPFMTIRYLHHEK